MIGLADSWSGRKNPRQHPSAAPRHSDTHDARRSADFLQEVGCIDMRLVIGGISDRLKYT